MDASVRRRTWFKTPRPIGGTERPILGVVLHHSAGPTPVECHPSGSWHYMIDRDPLGTVYVEMDEQDIAWHCAYTSRWRPDWVPTSSPVRWFSGSNINACTIGVELVSCPGTAYSGYSDGQLRSLRELLSDLVLRYGPLWVVGHGQVQSDRMSSEPADFPWDDMGLEWVDGNGYRKGVPMVVVGDAGASADTVGRQQMWDELARHELVHAGAVDQLVGRYDELAGQVESLKSLLATAQMERDAAMSSLTPIESFVEKEAGVDFADPVVEGAAEVILGQALTDKDEGP